VEHLRRHPINRKYTAGRAGTNEESKYSGKTYGGGMNYEKRSHRKRSLTGGLSAPSIIEAWTGRQVPQKNPARERSRFFEKDENVLVAYHQLGSDLQIK